MDYKEANYKVASRYVYAGNKEVVKVGDIFNKNSTVGYENVIGIEFSLQDAGKLFLAVDEMFYNISNQWEKGFDIEEFVGDLRNQMYKK